MKLIFITWNVAALPSLVNFSGTKTDKAKEIADVLLPYLETTNCLVVIHLQELFDAKLTKQLKYQFRNFKTYYPSERANFFFGITSGLMTIANHPFDYTKFVKYNNSHGEDSFANKGFTMTKIRGFMFYNTHMQNENVMIGSKEIAKNALHQQIKQFGESFKNENCTTLAGGDFNIAKSEMNKLIDITYYYVPDCPTIFQNNPDFFCSNKSIKNHKITCDDFPELSDHKIVILEGEI